MEAQSLTPGNYNNANVTVSQVGVVTSIANGAPQNPISAIELFGHSWLGASGATNPDVNYGNLASRLQAMFGVNTVDVINLSTSGAALTRINDSPNSSDWGSLCQMIVPYGYKGANNTSFSDQIYPTVSQPPSLFVHGINDINMSLFSAQPTSETIASTNWTGLTAWQNVVRGVVSRLNAGSLYPSTHSTISTSGTWTTQKTNIGTGPTQLASVSNGANVTVTLPTTFQGGVVRLYFWGTSAEDTSSLAVNFSGTCSAATGSLNLAAQGEYGQPIMCVATFNCLGSDAGKTITATVAGVPSASSLSTVVTTNGSTNYAVTSVSGAPPNLMVPSIVTASSVPPNTMGLYVTGSRISNRNALTMNTAATGTSTTGTIQPCVVFDGWSRDADSISPVMMATSPRILNDQVGMSYSLNKRTKSIYNNQSSVIGANNLVLVDIDADVFQRTANLKTQFSNTATTITVTLQPGSTFGQDEYGNYIGDKNMRILVIGNGQAIVNGGTNPGTLAPQVAYGETMLVTNITQTSSTEWVLTVNRGITGYTMPSNAQYGQQTMDANGVAGNAVITKSSGNFLTAVPAVTAIDTWTQSALNAWVFTTASAHGLVQGDTIYATGFAPAHFNGPIVVTDVINSTTFWTRLSPTRHQLGTDTTEQPNFASAGTMYKTTGFAPGTVVTGNTIRNGTVIDGYVDGRPDQLVLSQTVAGTATNVSMTFGGSYVIDMRWISSDGIHPNSLGAGYFASKFYSAAYSSFLGQPANLPTAGMSAFSLTEGSAIPTLPYADGYWNVLTPQQTNNIDLSMVQGTLYAIPFYVNSTVSSALTGLATVVQTSVTSGKLTCGLYLPDNGRSKPGPLLVDFSLSNYGGTGSTIPATATSVQQTTAGSIWWNMRTGWYWLVVGNITTASAPAVHAAANGMPVGSPTPWNQSSTTTRLIPCGYTMTGQSSLPANFVVGAATSVVPMMQVQFASHGF